VPVVEANPAGGPSRWAGLAVVVSLLVVAAAGGIATASAQGILYIVNTTSDIVVSGACANGNDGCSLRGAITAANSHVGPDGIDFALPAGSVINLTQALPDLSGDISIDGPGPGNLTVQRNAAAKFRIFNVTNSTSTGVVSLSGLTISSGFVDSAGGGIQNASVGTVNVINCVVRDNGAFSGAAIKNSTTGTVNVRNSTIRSNRASSHGAGVENTSGGTVTISNSSLVSNIIFGDEDRAARGGAIFSGGGTVTITGSTLASNQASGGDGTFGGAGKGAAIYTSLTLLNITNSSLIGNLAQGGNSTSGPGGEASGGAIFHNGTLNVTNCTFSGNRTSGGHGQSPGEFRGGGIFNDGGTANIKSTIIALNTQFVSPPQFASAPDVSGAFTSHGFNFIGKTNGSTGFTAATDQTGTSAAPLDPKFDTAGLKDNGGPTHTIALLCGSTAIDRGTSAGLAGNLTTDQRGAGFARSFGAGTDVGAFELQQTCAAPTPTATPTPTPTPTPGPTATATPAPTATPTVLANISTRLRVETGNNVLIGGIIITGTQPKKLIVRAIGPSSGVPGSLADPHLEIFDGSGNSLSRNDNWEDSPNRQEIIASTIPPTHPLESAFAGTLPPGLYTAVVSGVNGGTGIGVVEAYDLDRNVDSKFANIATRGLVQTGDNAMIGGLIVLGDRAQKVIVRAIGPSLTVEGKLADPTLELVNNNGESIAFNNNWRDDQEGQIEATTIPPSDDLESAIVATLPPAPYTAVVRGANDASGIALVEVYALE
jgi:hypothetical protein